MTDLIVLWNDKSLLNLFELRSILLGGDILMAVLVISPNCSQENQIGKPDSSQEV